MPAGTLEPAAARTARSGRADPECEPALPRTLIALDRTSSVPLYRQVRHAIEHGIATGVFVAHMRLPSSRELSAELGVSRNVVNLAYQELIAEGFVISSERGGLYVNTDLVHSPPEAKETPPAAERRIDWRNRVRRFGDAGLPHVSKPARWWEYPYPFVAGQVDLHTFPARGWTRVLRESLYRPHLTHSLQDCGSADDPMLVDMIRRHLLPGRGIEASEDQILVTVGSQQGLDLVSRLLLRPGDRVGVEDPGYLDAKHIFARAGADLVGFPVDRRGVRLPATLEGVTLMYVTPSHHHPTNVTLTIDRRRRLLDLAACSGTVVVEDDYDSEFRYAGQPTPALKALDDGGDVIYLGTFSKFLAPGLRLGYLVGPAEFVRELRAARRYSNRHPPGQLQRALALLIDSGDYQRTVRRHRAELSRRWAAVVDAVNTHLTWPTDPPPGGVSVWMSGPATLDANVLVRNAARHGVLIERGDIYFLDPAAPPARGGPAARSTFRIGFSAIGLEAIEPGIGVLARVVDEQLG